MNNYLLSLWRNRQGMAITEFALLLPILILIWGGIVELSTAHFVGRKVALATQSVADLVAQERSVTTALLDNNVRAGAAILFPYPANTLSFQIQSIVSDGNGKIKSDWLHTAPITSQGSGSIPPEARNLLTKNDSTIYVKVDYRHTPVLGSLIPGFKNFSITEEAFAKPRRTNIIPKN